MDVEKELLVSALLVEADGRFIYRVEASIRGEASELGTRDNPRDALALAAHAITNGADQVTIRHFSR